METYTGLDDPRMYPTREELPTTFEGAKKFPLWNAQLIDLNELPLEEYMKPMPVNVVSGGTGPGPTPPTPSGETTYFTTNFIASGKTYASYQIKSGKTVTEDYEVPTPSEEGYTFSGWTPDPATTVITAATNFNGWFIEIVENAYYSLAMFLKGSEFDPTSLERVDLSEIKQGKTEIFSIESSATYAEMAERLELDPEDEGYITQREFNEWYKNEFAPNNQYVVRFVCPTDVKNENISLKDEMGQPLPTPNPTLVTIDGVEYNCFDFEEPKNNTFVPTEEEQQIKLTIKID